QLQLRPAGLSRDQYPPAVGRDPEGPSLADPDGGGAIHPAQIDSVGSDLLLVEQNLFPVASDVHRKGPVQPGEVPVRAFTRRMSDDLASRPARVEQKTPGPGYVLQRSALLRVGPH